MHMREWWWLHCTSQWGWQTPVSEHVYCMAVIFKMTERVGQQICIKFCIKLEHFSTETIQRIQKSSSMGNWQSAASSRQCTLVHHVLCTAFWRNIKSPRWLSSPTTQIWCPVTSDFSKTKITFEREEVSDYWLRKIQQGSWWPLGEPCEVPRCLL